MMPGGKEWEALSNVVYAHPWGFNSIRVDTAWALLRFFRTGEGWGDQETKRRWAKEEYEAFLEREAVPKRTKPRLVPV